MTASVSSCPPQPEPASKSSTLRLLAPLVETSLVERRPDGGYAIDLGAVRLGAAYLNDLDLRRAADPGRADHTDTVVAAVSASAAR